MTKPETNPEGMTWREWYRAAGVTAERVRRDGPHVFLNAWRRGEDPTEHAVDDGPCPNRAWYDTSAEME